MEITKEQIKAAYQRPELLKELFPKAFEVELEVGKWYKYKRFLVHVIEAREPINRNNAIVGYGFNHDGHFRLWNDSTSLAGSHDLELATEEEVTEAEALTKELIKRYGEDWKNIKIIDND